jgi:phosphohistidine phosphatase
VKIYVIRHAHAIDGDNDDVRPLSKKGREQNRRVGSFFRRNGLLDTREFWHSPLVRARDTAKELAARLKGRIKLAEVTGLRPEDNPAIMAKRLDKVRRPVAVVGHEPHLSALASLLVTGRARPARFNLRKGAVLCLERVEKRWTVRWLVEPDLLA